MNNTAGGTIRMPNYPSTNYRGYPPQLPQYHEVFRSQYSGIDTSTVQEQARIPIMNQLQSNSQSAVRDVHVQANERKQQPQGILRNPSPTQNVGGHNRHVMFKEEVTCVEKLKWEGAEQYTVPKKSKNPTSSVKPKTSSGKEEKKLSSKNRPASKKPRNGNDRTQTRQYERRRPFLVGTSAEREYNQQRSRIINSNNFRRHSQRPSPSNQLRQDCPDRNMSKYAQGDRYRTSPVRDSYFRYQPNSEYPFCPRKPKRYSGKKY